MVKTMTSLLAFRLDEQQIVVIVALLFFEFQTCCAKAVVKQKLANLWGGMNQRYLHFKK